MAGHYPQLSHYKKCIESTVLTRSMKIRISNKPIEYPKWLNLQSEHISNALVPFLDMFNHKTGVKNKIQVWTDEIELRINEEISSEEEIFIDYGPWVKI